MRIGYQTHSTFRSALANVDVHTTICLIAAVALAVVGCDSGGNQSSSDDDPMSMGTSGSAAEKPEQKEGSGEVPPTGPASIDHGGITDIPDDPELAKKGEKIFNDNGCTACHKMKKSQVGPALGDVTERREPEWIAKMIMHPRQMLSKDPTAKKLLQEHGSRMADQGITPEEAKAIIAWLATQSKK